MRPTGYFLLIILSLSIFSYGFLGSIYAQQLPEASIPPLTVETELPLYSAGSDVVVSGVVKSLNENYDQPVIIRIFEPGGNMVSIGQVMPNADGSFSFQTTAGGTWKTSGEYTIVVHYGAQKADNTFEFIGGEEPPPPPPPPPQCGPNEILVDGECIEKEPPPPPKCGPNQILVDGVCVDKEPEEEEPPIICGEGTVLKDGVCVPEVAEPPPPSGCLIATAAFGSELAPQVQMLREIRDGQVLSTTSGTAFMTGFNQFYYSFSPTVADWERENPVFKETVKLAITPLLTTLSILNHVDIDSEEEMLGYGISLILLNIGIYFIAPALLIFKLKKKL